MLYVTTAIIIGYYLIFLLYYQKLYPPDGRKILPVILTFIFLSAVYIIFAIYDIQWLIIPISILGITISLWFTTGMNWLQSAYGAILSVISVYCFRGLFAAVDVLFIPGGYDDPLHNVFMYNLLTALAIPIALFCFYLLRKTLLPDRRLKLVLNNKYLLVRIVIYQAIAAINLMTINAGRTFIREAQWYSLIALCAFLLTLGMFIYIIIYSADIMELTDYKWRAKLLEEQYALQLRHYRAYEKYTKDFRVFRHDFNRMMPLLQTLVENKETNKAVLLIKQLSGTMQRTVHIHKKYSNHVVIDAMLQDLANLCEEHQIRYEFQAVSPKNTGLSLLDGIRILSNLSTNAVEACLKVPEKERFIEITCWCENNWTALQIMNSFDGEVHMEKGYPITTKKDAWNHGLGLISVREIVEKMHGLLQIDMDQKQRIFTVSVYLPEHGEVEQPVQK